MTENEKKKEYLKSYKNLCEKEESLEEQLQGLRESKASAQAVVIDDMPKGTHQGDLSDYMVKIDELERELAKAKKNKICRKLEIEEGIGKMEDGIESKILYGKYIKLKTWEQICVDIGYSWMQTHRYHARALQNFKI